MSRILKEIHIVCHAAHNVRHLGDGTFLTGYWVVKPEHIHKGVVLGLHEAKALPSYLQGIVLRVNNIIYEMTESGRRQRRIEVLVSATPIPFDWKGQGTGEKGLVWG